MNYYEAEPYKHQLGLVVQIASIFCPSCSISLHRWTVSCSGGILNIVLCCHTSFTSYFLFLTFVNGSYSIYSSMFVQLKQGVSCYFIWHSLLWEKCQFKVYLFSFCRYLICFPFYSFSEIINWTRVWGQAVSRVYSILKLSKNLLAHCSLVCDSTALFSGSAVTWLSPSVFPCPKLPLSKRIIAIRFWGHSFLSSITLTWLYLLLLFPNKVIFTDSGWTWIWREFCSLWCTIYKTHLVCRSRKYVVVSWDWDGWVFWIVKCHL